MRVIVCARGVVARRFQQELKPLGIELIERRPTTWRLNRRAGFEPFNAAVLELDALSPQQRHKAIASLQRQGICVVGLAGPQCECPWREYLEEDLDGVVSADCGAVDLACALWSAHRQFELRRVLAQRVDELQLALQHRKRIEQAKAVIAEMLEITEGEALKHLRREARNRRRPMHELAHVVIEAREILCNSHPRGETQDSSGMKQDGALQATVLSSLRLAE